MIINDISTQERRFRNLEHVYAAYIRMYPGPMHIEIPEGIEATTFANRVRKVAWEFLHNRWETSFSIEQFRDLWGDSKVGVTKDGMVMVRGRGRSKVAAAPAAQLPGQAMLTVKELGPNPRKTLMRLVWLHHIRAIDGGATHIQGLPEELGVAFAAQIEAQTYGNRKWSVDFRRHPKEPGWILS